MRRILLLSLLLFACSKGTAPAPEADVVAEAPPVEAAQNLRELSDQIIALPDKTPLKLLFVVTIKRGDITRTGEGKRALVFKVSDVTSAIGFTDRPQRVAFNFTVSAFASIWTTGSNSFAKDPPNAIIKDSRSRVGVTELTGFSIDGDLVKVSLDRVAYKSIDKEDSLDGDVRGLTLFIDSKWFKLTGAGLALGLQQAAKACVSVDCELWPLGA